MFDWMPRGSMCSTTALTGVVVTCATVGPTRSSACSAPFSNAALNSKLAGGGGMPAAACAEGAWEPAAVPLPARLVAASDAAGEAVRAVLLLLPPEGAPVGLATGCAVGAVGACCSLLAAAGAVPSAVATARMSMRMHTAEVRRRLRPEAMRSRLLGDLTEGLH